MFSVIQQITSKCTANNQFPFFYGLIASGVSANWQTMISAMERYDLLQEHRERKWSLSWGISRAFHGKGSFEMALDERVQF